MQLFILSIPHVYALLRIIHYLPPSFTFCFLFHNISLLVSNNSSMKRSSDAVSLFNRSKERPTKIQESQKDPDLNGLFENMV